ncbi:MAG: tyrosine-type recombinase/integrase [Syntrophaceae bacterium]
MQNVCNLTIKQLIKATDLAMHTAGYAEATIATYNKIWRLFSAHAVKCKTTQYSTEFAFKFLKERFGDVGVYPLTYTQAEYYRGINRIDEYFKYGIISSKRPFKKNVSYPAKFEELIRFYLLTKKSENLSNSRLHSLSVYLESFATFLHDIGVKGFDSLYITHINRYLEERVAQFTVSTALATVGCLRGFLTYLHKVGCAKADFSVFLPRSRHVSEETIPSAFSGDEVNKILVCVDRSNPKGKRDYAMLLLAARLGLRASDICGLEFSSLKWEENRVEFVQQKTGKLTSLPLLNEVGDAIIDYLRVRPLSDSRMVFLRFDPPHVRLHNHSLYEITQKYLKRSGIHVPNGKKHGPHSLRHSLSSILLESRVPLPVISEILSHSSSDTTKIYLKIDHGQLRECALGVPPMDMGRM